MASTRSTDVLEQVPEEWFEPVVGLWIVVLAIGGIVLTLDVAGLVLAPLGSSLVGAILVTAVSVGVSYGLFGFGATYGYLTYRGVTPDFALDRSAWRWVGGFGGLTVVLVGLGGAWSTLVGRSFEVVTPHFMIASVSVPEGWNSLLALDLAGVNEIVTFAPMVGLHAVLGGLLIAPAVGALFHGVLQDTLARVSSPAVAVTGTALATTLAVRGFAFHGVTTPRGFGAAVVAFVFVLGVAYAYRETGNLLVPMAAYGLCPALTLVAGWLTIVAQIYAYYGHL